MRGLGTCLITYLYIIYNKENVICYNSFIQNILLTSAPFVAIHQSMVIIAFNKVDVSKIMVIDSLGSIFALIIKFVIYK